LSVLLLKTAKIVASGMRAGLMSTFVVSMFCSPSKRTTACPSSAFAGIGAPAGNVAVGPGVAAVAGVAVTGAGGGGSLSSCRQREAGDQGKWQSASSA